tara:strand:+ start:7761 stop:8015 length:255 start_codon:yes stop_codon:yes gene_type:complete
MGLRLKWNFLYVNPGDYVAIKFDNTYLPSKEIEDYWIGKVINCIGGARDPKAWTLFQVMNIDSGEILIINADIVERIICSSKKD